MSSQSMRAHDFIKVLVESGMPERQAEAIVRQQADFNENLATKHDLELVEYKIELAKKDLTMKLGGMIVASALATTGIILSVVSLMLGGAAQ
ncbi:MAG: DUF1640 domain-containing protein [Gammaproteobacteria bacterium]